MTESELFSEFRKNLSISDLPNEVWKAIEGYENQYSISSLFRIRSHERFIREKKGERLCTKLCHERILRQYTNLTDGYWEVRLSHNGKRQPKRVHRLYALAFMPNPKNKSFINHKDLNKENNSPSNIEWSTPAENNKHAYDNGAIPFGEKVYCSKLKESAVFEIRKSQLSSRKLARLYGVTPRSIIKIRKGLTWKNIKYGEC